MLIYYLHRDLDNARNLCERAIEIGNEQLAEMEDDVSERDRHMLEEAVGDAWQNIAVLLRTHKNAPFKDYQRFCEEAVKFYPYQRREAAAMLRNKGENQLGSTARGMASGSNSGSSNASLIRNTQQSGAAEALKKAMPEIDKHAGNEDYDSALNVLDKLAKDCKGHAPYRFIVGKITWRLANQARDSGRKGTGAFYQDAMNAFQKAVELDPEPIEPRQMLAQAQFDSNEAQKAAETISSLLLHMQSKGGGTEEQVLAAHALRANAASRAYAKAKNDGNNDTGLLTSSRTSMRWLEQKGKLTMELLKLWSATEQWAEAPAEATNVYIRASERAPTDFALLDLVVNTAASQKQLPLAIASLQKRDDAGTVWYLGKAQYYQAGDQRQGGTPDEAVTTIDAAIASFTKSMTKNAGYKDSCEQWIAMCLGKQGNIAFSLKKYDESEKLLLKATAARPDLINQDLGLIETTKRGILFLVDYYRRKNNLEKCESISRGAAESALSDIDLQNNSGLFARDYGNMIERNGKVKEAQEMYEQSYKAYGRAVQLDGKNVRLRNDLALIAIYHLDRDWDKVKVLLDSAIVDGERTLEDSPPDDADEKQQLEEAVGDSYENLALWHLKHSKDGAAAKAAATKSQDYYPGKRRPGARRHLRSAEQLLQGK
jgi:tetratricopeptide (TPR) repeat protein